MAYLFERLNHSKDVLEAKRFLKNIYINQLNWSIPTNNPSGLFVCQDVEGDYLEDNFSAMSVWFRIFDENAKTVAVVRVIDRRYTKLEIEQYRELPKHFTENSIRSVEINRFAVIKNSSSSEITLKLMLHVLKELIFEGFQYAILTAQSPQPAKLFRDLGMSSVEVSPFKYHDSDPNEVEVLYLDLMDKNSNDLIIKKLS